MPTIENEDIINQLIEQFPKLIILEKYSGYVLNKEEGIVYTRLVNEKGDEFDCEINQNLFPLEDFNDNISFYLICGTINKQPFTHINYFYWTEKDLIEADKKAEELFLIFSQNIEDN